MTDRDVLERVQRLFGGAIYACSTQQAHHKPSWRWVVNGEYSVEVVTQIIPLLGARRGARALEYVEAQRVRSRGVVSKRRVSTLRDRARDLAADGLSHREIGAELGVTRSYVTHILRGRYDAPAGRSDIA